jgi:hypothetical protein
MWNYIYKKAIIMILNKILILLMMPLILPWAELLKLHASRWAEIFQENQTWEKFTEISKKVKRFK